jgi:PAS domain S-box-containing protein
MSSVSAIAAASPKYRRVWVTLALSVVLIAVMSAFVSRSLATLNEGAAWVQQSERVRFQLALILQSLSDLGSGVTGYQLTHDPTLFEPAQQAAQAVPAELDDLEQLVAGDRGQRRFVAQLKDIAAQRELQTRGQRERALNGDLAGIRAEISGGEAKRTMDAARSVIAQMQTQEKHLLEVHGNAAQGAYSTVIFAIWGAAGMAIFLLVSITLVTVRDAERLRGVQEELAITLRSVGDAVIATDEAGAVRFINTVAEQLTGWSNDAARGLPLEEVLVIINEQTRMPVESPVARVLRSNSSLTLASHSILRSRDGTERPIEDSVAPIRGPGGELTGVVMVFRDATAERAARRSLIESRDALREADYRKDVFLATLSHELRNPLAPIRTAARVLETPHLTSAELERSRSIISRQVRHMATLLDDLLDISRITRGVLTLKSEYVDLRALMETAVETAQPAINAKQHVLEIEWPPETIDLQADPVRLTQVIANLLTNSAKYTRPGGKITLGARREGRQARIYVRDNGIGIAPDMLPRVFDMFSQIDSGQEHTEGGIGIGLALVKGFVELHGGSVAAKSPGLGRGSEFIVSLPALPADSASPPRVAPARAQAPLPHTGGVLVADDNRDGAEIMATLLGLSGYEVYVAHTGPEALAMAEKHQPSVAILDIGMPGMSGYEVAMGIRGEPWGSRIQLIAVTGWGQDEDKRKARDAGFDHHLTKPIDPDELQKLMSTAALSQA